MSESPSPFEALIIAIDRAGSQAALARILGVGQPAVSKWVAAKRPLPAKHVIAVEQATGVSRHLLSPTIYPVANHA